MSAEHTIKCQDCGTNYVTKRNNTKFCASCRLLRDFKFIKEWTCLCWLCKRKMSPLHKGDETCGYCEYQPQKFGEAKCVFCHETKLRCRPAVDVCHECSKMPSKRREFTQGLAAGQIRRARENK